MFQASKCKDIQNCLQYLNFFKVTYSCFVKKNVNYFFRLLDLEELLLEEAAKNKSNSTRFGLPFDQIYTYHQVRESTSLINLGLILSDVDVNITRNHAKHFL